MIRIFKNQRGAIDIILILVVFLFAVGFGGYVYWQQRQTQIADKNASGGVTMAKHTKKPKPVPDPTANWTAFASVKGKFSLKYPPTWSKVICTGDEVVYLGPNANAVAVCNSGFTGQMVIQSQSGDQSTADKLAAADYNNLAAGNLTVNAVAGTKQTGISKGNGVNIPVGMKVIRYTFAEKGQTVMADYFFDSANKNEQDVSADFDTMIQKTLKFQ